MVNMFTIPDRCKHYFALQRPEVTDFVSSVEDDFKTLEAYLPENVNSILDIGCGMAGIDIPLKKRYPEASLNLLDSDGKKCDYGWKTSCAPYNSREATDELLKENNVKVDRWIEAGTQELLIFDLIISIISWGFHYPLSTYNVKGFCFADLRKGKEPVRGRVIYEALKYNRCAFEN